MKLGIDTAFNRANDAGGVDGRMLRLIAADDGYEPTRTLEAMKQLYEKEQVFGFIGNVGTPTAAVAIPYALERRTLFFGAFTGANVLRHDPPDRYVFNYRASYAEETDAVVRYLVKLRRLQPRQIAVFAQQDAYGDAGFAGVAKAFRALGVNDGAILRLDYKRNTVDVDDAVNQLKAQKRRSRPWSWSRPIGPPRSSSRRRATLYPGMIYTNVSFVGCTALAEELMLLGPRFATGVIVTQVVPAVGRLFERGARIQERACQIFPGRGAGLRLARRLCRRQRADPGAEARRPADRHREAHRQPRGHAQSRSRPRNARSISAAPNTRPRTRSGERRSTKPASTSRSNSNERAPRVRASSDLDDPGLDATGRHPGR